MTVVNKKTHKPTTNDVYIGRGSKWGNPYRIGIDGDRQRVIELYELRARKLLRDAGDEGTRNLLTLKDKNLVCFCTPSACHGHILEQLIKEIENGTF